MSEKKAVKTTHLTKKGLENIEKELNLRKGEMRREIADRLDAARRQGDLSENSEYDEAKEAQSQNEEKIKELEEKLEHYELIDEDSDTSTVKMGHRVVLYDCENDEEDEYYLVGSSEADPLNGKISNESPVGAAILGKVKGDEITVKTPGGEAKYIIRDIKAAAN